MHDRFDWIDPKSEKVKPLKSIKVLVNNGDGTVTRESISLPDGMAPPELQKDEAYVFQIVQPSYNRKKDEIRYTLLAGSVPFPAPVID